MRVRTLAVGLLVSGLALATAACGKSGSPTDNANAGAPPALQVAKNVDVAGSPTFAKMKQRKHVIVGVKDAQPGLGYKDLTTGKYSGFDIDIANYISAQLGFDPAKIEYKAVPSASREQALVNGDVDYYVGTYTINDKRKKQVAFAGPYFVAGQDLLVRKDNTDITGPRSLMGKKVCSVTGSTPIQNVRAKKLTQASNIVEYQKYSDCVTALEQGKVDVLTTDDAILKGYAAQEPDKLKVVGKPFTKEPYGVGLPHDDKALRDKVNDILQTAMDNGTWQKFYDETLGKSGSKATPPKLERY
ncbi:MAG: glutamate ABC transporter substrate-binding protein [Sciscionella sp.]